MTKLPCNYIPKNSLFINVPKLGPSNKHITRIFLICRPQYKCGDLVNPTDIIQMRHIKWPDCPCIHTTKNSLFVHFSEFFLWFWFSCKLVVWALLCFWWLIVKWQNCPFHYIHKKSLFLNVPNFGPSNKHIMRIWGPFDLWVPVQVWGVGKSSWHNPKKPSSWLVFGLLCGTLACGLKN